MPRLNRWLVTLSLSVGLLEGCATAERVETPADENGAVPAAGEIPSDYTISKQIRYSYTLRNTTGRLLPEAQFWTYAPVPRTAHQWVENIASSQPYRSTRDALGNEILHFAFENLPPYASKIISITVDLKMTAQAAATVEETLERFTRPERYIEADDPRLARLATALNQLAPAGSMRMAHDWVAANLKPETYMAEDRGAVYAFEARKGDCTEFAYLLAALGRANGIPVRPMGGYVFEGNGIVQAVDYHNWVEFFADGRWQIADAHKKTFMQNQDNYVAMRIIASGAESPLGESHRYSYAGDGLEVLMN